ncbi:hypothetical protein ACFCYM_15715 [Streptomyces sp. NPDC056254]|uniref:hypothetical protein n=1 Tax=Streptomyces sp. NPDC056254 TaxID=3345763 RepID=UPI0035DEFAF4
MSRLVTAGLALLLLGLFGVCCSLTAHGSETAAVQVASASLMNTEGQEAASVMGCSEGMDHSSVEGARRSSAPSCAAAKPDLADALDEARTSSSPWQVSAAERMKQSTGGFSAGSRSHVVLQV